jgi:hypothetical protein
VTIRIRRVRLHKVALLLAAILSADRLHAAQPAAAKRLLFIGNSLTYVNNLPAIVDALAVAGGNPAPVVRDVVFGGASLEDHWKRGPARVAIAEGHWDFVVLQQGPSSLPESRMLLIQYTRLFAKEIRKAGATPVLYMVWPSSARSEDFPGVIESYRLAAKEVDGILCPVGEAWRIASKRDPGLGLYSVDGLHPTPAGSYLAGLVIYARLYGKSPMGLPSELELPGGAEIAMSPEQAKLLQGAASEAAGMTSNGSGASDHSDRLPHDSAEEGRAVGLSRFASGG